MVLLISVALCLYSEALYIYTYYSTECIPLYQLFVASDASSPFPICMVCVRFDSNMSNP